MMVNFFNRYRIYLSSRSPIEKVYETSRQFFIKNKHRLNKRVCPLCGSNSNKVGGLPATPVNMKKCVNCGIFYAPLVFDEAILADYYRDPKTQGMEDLYFDKVKKNSNNIYHKQIICILRHLKDRDLAIEIGCSFGQFISCFKPYFNEVLGLELNKRTSRIGSKQFGITILNKKLEEVNLKEDSVDLIIINQVLEHLSNLDSILREISKSLKRGGLLYIGVPNPESLSVKIFKEKHAHLDSFTHINMFTRESFVFIAKKYEFEIVDLRTCKDLDITIDDLLAKKDDNFMHRYNFGLFTPISLLTQKSLSFFSKKTDAISKLSLGSYYEVILRKNV